MECSECGYRLWSKIDEEKGAHLECLGYEEPVNAIDLEDRLETAFNQEGK
jgi:hypothetical protein